jgi:hypothetical protein
MALDVEVDKLREFARLLDNAAGSLTPLKNNAALADAAAALPGTDVGAALNQCASAITTTLGGIAGRVAAMSGLAHGSAGNYQITEDDFTHALGSIQP